MKITRWCVSLLVCALAAQTAYGHENSLHAIFENRTVTIAFDAASLEATETQNVQVLQARLEAGRLLQRAILADMRKEPCGDLLRQSFAKLQESRAGVDTFKRQLEGLRTIAKDNRVVPEFEIALARILKQQPQVERVSLTYGRFSNVAQGNASPKGSLGTNLDELLGGVLSDLAVLGKQLDQTIDAMRQALTITESGGIAALMLSGRAALPERALESAEMVMILSESYGRACRATIAAAIQVYPKELEWLRKPAKGHKALEASK